MSRLKTVVVENLPAIKAALPEIAAMLEGAMKRGRPKGDGERNEWLADVWSEIDDAISSGEDEATALAKTQQRTGLEESIIDGLWHHLHARPAVKAILTARGRVK